MVGLFFCDYCNNDFSKYLYWFDSLQRFIISDQLQNYFSRYGQVRSVNMFFVSFHKLDQFPVFPFASSFTSKIFTFRMLRRVYIADLRLLHLRIQKVLQEQCNNDRT
ncbi:hypothetical protein Y032_0560g3467 [Ancylostoma ceylanicum]|uniref:RRM domain-containing protein n=1 Tax=Ancylostoma ceylanicum TaxID=53326 RepID=A0A016WQ03_9BILA|nr:hypothetical protein Y032_0560g3467 [Ancylostoma ceylanicum]